MRRFSRHMPVPPAGTLTRAGWAVLAAFAAMLLLAVGWSIFAIGIQGTGVVAVIFAGIAQSARLAERRRLERLRALARDRVGEGICGFARSFPRGSADPWVIRAVYQEVAWWYRVDDRTVAIRADDRFEVSGIDGDSVDDLADDVARRAGYSLERTDNPFYGRVHTVGDLVRFFGHQPRTRPV